MTPDGTPPTATGPADGAWSEDPLELDRTLEGQVDEATLRARRAELERLGGAVAERRAFLDALAAGGAAWRAGARERTPPALESRVRFALRRARAMRRLRTACAAAAVLLVALVAWRFHDGGREATAMPQAVMTAAAVARETSRSPGVCAVPAESGPMQFPPVKEGSLRVRSCRTGEEGTIASLYRPEDLPSIGYVAVAAEGVDRGPDLGMTDLGDVVVYDLVYGRKRHYLAVSKAFLDEQAALDPGRESCRACHNHSRDGMPNPHNIVRRSWEARR